MSSNRIFCSASSASVFRLTRYTCMRISWMLSYTQMRRRVLADVAGIILAALSMALLRLALFGNDPYSCMNLGISAISGLSFGTCTTGMILLLFIPVLLLERHYIKPGSIIYLALLGPVSDAWYTLLIAALGTPETLPLYTHVLLLISGILISAYGVSLYLCADLGLGPYDALPWIIEHRSHGRIPFRWARVLCDSTCLVIGFMLGSLIGIGTLILACFMGPLMSFCNTRINMPLIYGKSILSPVKK